MTSFSDDDLKWLRDQKNRNMNLDFGSSMLKALLARLEAAEKVCVGIETVCEAHNLQGQARADLKAWRKSAGKP